MSKTGAESPCDSSESRRSRSTVIHCSCSRRRTTSSCSCTAVHVHHSGTAHVRGGCTRVAWLAGVCAVSRAGISTSLPLLACFVSRQGGTTTAGNAPESSNSAAAHEPHAGEAAFCPPADSIPCAMRFAGSALERGPSQRQPEPQRGPGRRTVRVAQARSRCQRRRRRLRQTAGCLRRCWLLRWRCPGWSLLQPGRRRDGGRAGYWLQRSQG